MARVSAEDKTERESTKAVVAEEIVFRLKVLSWPKTWAKLRPLIEILSQNARPRRSGQPREARAPEPQPRRSVAPLPGCQAAARGAIQQYAGARA